MITLEKALLSVISGGCDECNQSEVAVETNENNQNLLENNDIEETSSSLSHFEPIFSAE